MTGESELIKSASKPPLKKGARGREPFSVNLVNGMGKLFARANGSRQSRVVDSIVGVP